MKKFNLIIAIAILLVFNACFSLKLKVKQNRDETVDFTKYKTYSFLGWVAQSGENLNELDKKRVQQAFAAELKKRGLEYVKDSGDLVMSLFVQFNNETKTQAYINHYNMGGIVGYGSYYPAWGWGTSGYVTTYNDKDYIVGTLVVDALDAKTRKLIWQAVASKSIGETEKIREKNTPKMAKKFMHKFPIKNTK